VGLRFDLRASRLLGRHSSISTTLPALFCVGYFQDRVSWTICLGWPRTIIFLISASWVPRIIGVSHQYPARCHSLLWILRYFSLKACEVITIWITSTLISAWVRYASVTCRCEVLRAGVESPCLHRPENWLVKQLIDEPKPVYKVGFIREKGKATARACSRAWKPVARCSGEGWVFYRHFNCRFCGLFSLALDSRLS
jgi:hypothetical protein